VTELQASEAGLKKSKAELEDKLQQLEELLASTTATRDELQGGQGAMHASAALLSPDDGHVGQGTLYKSTCLLFDKDTKSQQPPVWLMCCRAMRMLQATWRV
jgi:hypothetical protein